MSGKTSQQGEREPTETVRSTGGMVTAPHHLAAEAGREVLREGGNAVEAMIAMAACCAVVYPHMNALGGGGFWIVKPAGCAPVGIDACGAAARGGAWPVKPLAADWKERLRRKPDAWPRSGGAVVRRRSTGAERTAAFAVAWWGVRGRNVPASRYRCPDKEEAACRLLSNPRVNTDHVLESAQGTHGRALPQGTRGSGGPGHGDAALQRRSLRPGVARRRVQRHRRPHLRPQDARSGSSRPPCATTRTGARASVGHFDKAQEIARACPDTRVVTVCDREGDGAVVASGRDGRRPRGARPPARARAVRRRQRKGALGRRNGRC